MNSALLCLLAACEPVEPPPAPPIAADDVAVNNRGVALMGRFEYEAARETFAEVIERRPEWVGARINLAIATLNRQEPGDERAALAIIDEVLAAEPDNLRAHYVAGLLSLYRGETGGGYAHFETVARKDTDDAYAAYYVAQSLLQAGEVEATLPWYERAIERDPYLRSAYYGAALALRRLGRTDEARDMLEQYDRFKDNPRATLAEFKYTRMGPKAEAVAIGDPDAPPPAAAEGPLFGEREWFPAGPAGDAAADLTTADLDGNGRQDLFLARVGAPAMVMLGGDDGRFTEAAGHPLAAVSGAVAALWGDLDNDGLVDVYLCRQGPNQLWRQRAQGEWEDVTATSGTANGDRQCAAGALFDADHDGDLDIFVVNSDGPDELLNNNLDGSFRPLADAQGLAGPGGGGLGIVTADLDRDRDADIVVIRDRPPHDVYLNDRLWDYRAAPGFAAFRASETRAAVAGDVDADGRPELYTVDAAGELRQWRNEDGEWRPRTLAQWQPAARALLALQDFDGDGVAELLAARGNGIAVYRIGADSAAPVFEGPDVVSPLPVLVEPRNGPSLVAVEPGPQGARLAHWPPGPGRHAFVALSLTGRDERGESMRSNASGIGTSVALRVGSRWSLTDTFDSHSAPGQSLQPVPVGLGGAARADYVALHWSDGVFQTELGLEPGLLRIAETQRQLASCPVLFAFDGSDYAFVSDLLGVGGLGFLVAPGEYAPPRPWEYLRLPQGLAAPKQGRYAFKLTEPMEESAYVDALRLHVYDLPPGWSMVLDERFAAGAPEPTGEPVFYRRAVAPSSAIDARGADVTAALLERDLQAPPVGPLDRRFIGLLAAPQGLTLEFGAALDAAAGRPVLVADGWVEYPYSQTVFAAWQAGVRYEAPTLEARGGDGRWRTVHERFGYPAGMPREMSLPLDALPAGTDALRLTTNQEIYWDRIRVAFAEPLPGARVEVLEPVLGELRKTGFARRTTGAQRVPHYNYAERTPFWDTKYQTGLYTRFGDVLPLIADVDDALAIIGPGEETHFEFAAGAGPPAGWRRELVLEARGYAKDMDLYTEHGETVGPLPLRAGATAEPARQALHARYNTRFQGGY